jgi:CheY-like chemotaxis protein
MEAIGQLTGGVAHDFNNLLTIIRSSVDLISRPDFAEERKPRYIQAISETVDRAAKLTGQLLAFARRQSLDPQVFDAAERTRRTAEMVNTVAGARIRLELEADCDACFVEADAAQFETAIVNLAVNARDAMDGEGVLGISVSTAEGLPSIRGHHPAGGDYVAISVSDTGTGIGVEALPHIFEPFFTTKEVGRGTGLGLSQVYGFAKQSGGDVQVQSEVGRGTRFTLYLPRVPAPPPGEGQAEPKTVESVGQRILVVEDNIEVGEFATQLLEELGHRTSLAPNGMAALEILRDRAGDFDLVFTDVVMPGMSGVELAEEVRRLYPTLRVVLTSGYSHVLAREGTHGFELLRKPYSIESLTRLIGRRRRGDHG